MEQEPVIPSEAQKNDAPAKSGGLNKNIIAIAVSIVIAGGLIAGAIIFSGKSAAPASPSPDNASPITKADHYRGELNAPVKIIEFSDTECPYCKSYHQQLRQAMIDYPDQVLWVYRHMPLDIHPRAAKQAEATECAAEQGGNEKFWAYLDRIFEITPSNNGLDPAELPKIAAHVGLDVPKFMVCLDSGKYADKISKQSAEGDRAGAEGTPYSVIITRKGERVPLSGAPRTYEIMKKVIEQALAN